jgi:salicylate hydroxylase
MRIAVVGCGPGGLASALFLHRAGHEVTLYDQFDQPKPLGSGLLIQPSGQEVLEQLGLLDHLRQLSAPVTRLFGINAVNQKRALDMQYRYLGEAVSALGIHRSSLFDILFHAVKKERIKIKPKRKLLGALDQVCAVQPQFEGAEAEVFDLLIDAAGANSPLAGGEVTQLPFAALWTTVDMDAGCGIAEEALDQRYVGACKMAGIMPVGINPVSGNPGAALFWSIKPEDYPALKALGIDAWKHEFLDLWPEAEPFVRQIASFDQLTLAIYRHRTGKPVSGRRIFHVGDSWHCTSPQLGQGANMALLDAAAIATAVDRSIDLVQIAQLYRHQRSDHVTLYQALSYVFTPLYQSDSRVLPVLRDLTIDTMGRWPVVRTLIAKLVSGNFGNFSSRL